MTDCQGVLFSNLVRFRFPQLLLISFVNLYNVMPFFFILYNKNLFLYNNRVWGKEVIYIKEYMLCILVVCYSFSNCLYCFFFSQSLALVKWELWLISLSLKVIYKLNMSFNCVVIRIFNICCVFLTFAVYFFTVASLCWFN